MRNTWLVARHEYRRMVVRRGFLVGTLIVPAAIAALIAMIVLVEALGENNSPVGYVDRAGLLQQARQEDLPDSDEVIEIRAFADEDAALEALDREEIQAFFVLPTDYLQTLRTDLYYLEDPPSSDAWRTFDDFVRLNLLAGLPADVEQRLLEGPNIIVQDIASNREFGDNTFLNFLLPFAASFFFFVATVSASSYMLRVVADEKENRTMEIMITSITPGQLIGGKAIGLLAAALTQLAIYVLAAVVALQVAAPYAEPLQQATVPWDYLALMAVFFLPAYALIASFMIALGGVVTDFQQGQQMAGLLNLLFMLPMLLIALLFDNPASPTFIFLTFFPTTSFMTILLRWGLGTIPIWHLLVSWVILVVTTLITIWAAVRVFRAGMLRYGQPLSLKGVWRAVVNG